MYRDIVGVDPMAESDVKESLADGSVSHKQLFHAGWKVDMIRTSSQLCVLPLLVDNISGGCRFSLLAKRRTHVLMN